MNLRKAAFRVSLFLWCLVTATILVFYAWIDGIYLFMLFDGVGAFIPLFWGGFAVFALVKAALGLVRRERGAWRYAVVPAAAVAAVLIRGDMSTVLRYWIDRPNMLEVIAAKRQETSGPVFHYFMWEGFMGASLGIAFDETDEVAKPVNRRANAWKATKDECYRVRHSLGAHFYFVYTCN